MQEQEISYTPLYYATPCQVKFYDANACAYRGGIALYDYIICGCCGEMLLTDEVVKNAEMADIHWDDAVIELEWIDLSDIIKG